MSFIKENFVNYFFIISSFSLLFLFKSNSEIYNLGLIGFIGISACFLFNYRLFFKNIDSLDVIFLVLLLIIIASSFFNNEFFFYTKRIVGFAIGFLAFKYIKEKFSEKDYNFLFYLFNLILGFFSIFLLLKSYSLSFEILEIVDSIFVILKPTNAIVHIVILLFITLFILFRKNKNKILILLLNLFIFSIVSILISSSTFFIILFISLFYLILSKFNFFKKIYLINYLLIFIIFSLFYLIYKNPNPHNEVSKIYNRLLFNYSLIFKKELKHHDIFRVNNMTYINDTQSTAYIDRSRFIIVKNDKLKVIEYFMNTKFTQDNFKNFNNFRKKEIQKGKDYFCTSISNDGEKERLIDHFMNGIFYPGFKSPPAPDFYDYYKNRKSTCERIFKVLNELKIDENLYYLNYESLNFFEFYSLDKEERQRILYNSSLLSDEYPVPLFYFGKKKDAKCIDNKDRKLILDKNSRISQTKPFYPSLACFYQDNTSFNHKNLLSMNQNDLRFFSIVVDRHRNEISAPLLSLYYSLKQRVVSIKQHLIFSFENPLKGLGNWVVSRDWKINDDYKWVVKSKPHNSIISFFQLHGIFALILIILLFLQTQILFQKEKNHNNIQMNSLYLLIFILLINLEDYFANAVFVSFYFYIFSFGLIFSTLRK